MPASTTGDAAASTTGDAAASTPGDAAASTPPTDTRPLVLRVLEVLGGARPLPAALESRAGVAFARGVWWLLLFLVAWAFAGRGTKFVYVDF